MDDVTFCCSGPYGNVWLVALQYRGKVCCLPWSVCVCVSVCLQAYLWNYWTDHYKIWWHCNTTVVELDCHCCCCCCNADWNMCHSSGRAVCSW